MKIEGSVALVTGANRGLGAAFCRRSSGAAPTRSTPGPATSLSLDRAASCRSQLDVTSATDIAAAAERAGM